MRIFIKKVLLLSLISLVLSPIYAKELKIGVLNTKALEEAPQFKAAQDKLEKEFKPRQTKLEEKQKELQTKHEALHRDRDILGDKEKLKQERELTRLQQNFQQQVEEFEIDHRSRQQEEYANFTKLIDSAVQDVAKLEKYDLVLHGQVALYNSDGTDEFTSKVLKELNKKSKSRG